MRGHWKRWLKKSIALTIGKWKRARLETDWEDADADTFEEVIYHAAEILGVVID